MTINCTRDLILTEIVGLNISRCCRISNDLLDYGPTSYTGRTTITSSHTWKLRYLFISQKFVTWSSFKST